jgi:N-acetylated-alpha-linked acidic dipeptidase
MPYHWGGTDAVKVHLAVKSDWSLKPVYDVIAKLPGKTYPDQWVVRGNHRDGWVMGAADPLSGHVAMMSEAKALGQMVRSGWRPARTIVYASWDGEEPGLLGSTEWAEAHADELKRKAVLYINTDNNGRGYLYAQGNGELQRLMTGVAADVADPQTGVPVLERSRAALLASHYIEPESVRPGLIADAKAGKLPLGALGSGSDYSSFAQHIGIPSLNLGFGGEDQSGGSYHSVYDSYYHVMHFDDPGLAYGAALSKVIGRVVLRSVDAPRVPAHYSDLAGDISDYISDIQKLAENQRERDRNLADLRRETDFKLASSPVDPTTAPPDEGITPLIDMLALQNASDHLDRAAGAADAMLAHADQLPPATQARINGALNGIDQLLLDPQGLPGRSWYKNLISAPGMLTGYGAKTLPGVREAIEQRRWDDARAYVGRTAAVIEAYANRLDQAVAMAGSGS